MKMQAGEARTIHVRFVMFVFPIACSSLHGLVFVLIHRDMQTPMHALLCRGITRENTHGDRRDREKGTGGHLFSSRINYDQLSAAANHRGV